MSADQFEARLVEAVMSGRTVLQCVNLVREDTSLSFRVCDQRFLVNEDMQTSGAWSRMCPWCLREHFKDSPPVVRILDEAIKQQSWLRDDS